MSSGAIQVRITPFILDPRWVIQRIYLCENVYGSSYSHEKNVMKFEVFFTPYRINERKYDCLKSNKQKICEVSWMEV